MICPACGAGLSKAMVEAGECGYCHTAIPRTAIPHTALPQGARDDLAEAIEKLAEQQAKQPQVVHVTKVELGGPSINLGGLFDSLVGRLFGCLSGCLSAGISLAITVFIFAIVAWQVWAQMPSPPPPPTPAPAARPAAPAPAPAPDHGRRRR